MNNQKGGQSREKVVAKEKLLANWPPKEHLFWEEHFNDLGKDVFITNSVGFSKRQIELKGSETWRWNQSIANIDFQIDENTQVKMIKFNSRRRIPGTGELPSYKIWIYEVGSIVPERVICYFFWCEKGIEAASIVQPLTSITLSDLLFLKPFMTEEECS